MTTLPWSSKQSEEARFSSERVQTATTYLSGVNGLRALGIVAVILYHLRPSSPAQGGFIGVTLFFVISGFLVTRSLMRELDSHHEISVGRFLLRRLMRLWPSMLVVAAFSALASFFFSPMLLVKLHEDAIPALAFFSNWFYIFRDVPYFAQAGLPSPLTHLWFVGVIMQFYLLVPVIVLLLHEFFRSRRNAAIAVLVFAVLSAVEMGILYSPGMDSARVYYGLDTRLAELLVGVALAYAEPYFSQVKAYWMRVLSWASWVGLGALVLVCLYARGYMTWLYRGGFFGAALVCALLICGASVPGAFSRLLSTRPFQIVASRSMSAYIWHYPLILLMNPAKRTLTLPWWSWFVQAGVFLVITEASYRFVENASSFASAQTWKALRGGDDATGKVRLTASLLAVALVLNVTAACVSSSVLEAGSKKATASIAQRFSVRPSAPHASVESASPSASPSETVPRYHDANGKLIEPQAAVLPEQYDPSQWACSAEDGACSVPLVLIGDSVAEGASYYWIPTLFPHSFTDTEVGRSFERGVALYRDALTQGHDGSPVIVALGGNGPITSMEALQPLVDAAGERPIFLVNIRAPYPFQDENNALMAKLAEKYPQVGLLDWYKASEGHDEYFYDDGQHLTEEGREAYARMIVSGLMGKSE